MLNLITDSWIPVMRENARDIIRPDQITDPDVIRFDWPRPDLNLACHELLIGLTYLACPPKSEQGRSSLPDASALRDGLAPLAPAFNLLGDGPLFLQDFEPLEGSPSAPDMLFIDGAGESTAKKNADVMVRRARYPVLDLPLAAMALFTLQAFAPAGGAGNRTSMRGGGPMVTLVKPRGQGLWPLIWANVPFGEPLTPETLDALPWMRPTRTSESKQVVIPGADTNTTPPEMFFGQPRRLRLVGDEDGVTGVIQRPYGTNYESWVHDLSPYYRDAKGQLLPMHPKPGPFGYRNWRGVLLQSDKRQRPATLERFLKANRDTEVDLVVAGWAMDNMKPLDFLWSEQPVFALGPEAEDAAIAMVEAAEHAGYALANALRDALNLGEIGGPAEAARLSFFVQTQGAFERRVGELSTGKEPDPKSWLSTLRKEALRLFDQQALPGLSEIKPIIDAKERVVHPAVEARKMLIGVFAGYGATARKIFAALELDTPPKPKARKETA